MVVNLDFKIIDFCQKYSNFFARLALFAVYFWFGFLKILDVSPANPLVMELQQKTLPFMSFPTFIVLFALLEMLIGLLFLFPKFNRIVLPLFGFHMITTLMPLIFLSKITWQKTFVPTLEGQYIIKNLALIALAMSILFRAKSVRNK